MLFRSGVNIEARLELGDAWFKALAAKQLAKAADHAAAAQVQDSVAAAAQGYFELVKARAVGDIAAEAARIAGDYAEQLQRGVELGIIFKGDALRARGQAQRNQLAHQQAREQQREEHAQHHHAQRASDQLPRRELRTGIKIHPPQVGQSAAPPASPHRSRFSRSYSKS